MNQYKRNIVVVGLNEREKEKLWFKDVRESKDEWNTNDYTHRFPYVIFEDTLEDGLKHQGFLIIIKTNIDSLNYIEYDIKNRHKFKKFNEVYFYNENKKINCINRSVAFNKIHIISSYDLFYDFSEHFLKRNYLSYIESEKFKDRMTKKRKENIEKLNKYLKGKKFVNVDEVAKDLNVSNKWVIRYMEDLYLTHQNIGCITKNKEWYVTK